jgi:GntR family transcriptional regulator
VSRAEQSSDDLPERLPDGQAKGEAVRKIIEALVASLGPGAPLPSERVLADRYGLARMTVRREVDRLVAEGIVFRMHGRGSFVAEPRVAQSGLFSSFSEDMRARGLTPGSIVRSRELTAAAPFVAPVAEIERLRTADGAPLALERVYLPAERFPGVRESDLEHGSLFELLAGRYEVSLTHADQRVLAVAIDPREAALLRVRAGAPGLRFHTLARDAKGTPAYYATSLFRGDRYEIELHQTRALEHVA